VDAVERLVAERVPDALLESMELDVLPGGLVLRLAAGERSLSMGLAFDGRLAVQGWEIAGPRPISGRSGGDVGTTLDLAVRALTEG
jgi:hypothetical protein